MSLSDVPKRWWYDSQLTSNYEYRYIQVKTFCQETSNTLLILVSNQNFIIWFSVIFSPEHLEKNITF